MCHDSTQLHNLSVPKKSVNGQSSDIFDPSFHPLFPKLSKAMHSYWHPNHNIPSYQWSTHLCFNRHDAEKKVYVFPLPHWSPTASIELVEGCRVQPILSEIGMIRFHHLDGCTKLASGNSSKLQKQSNGIGAGFAWDHDILAHESGVKGQQQDLVTPCFVSVCWLSRLCIPTTTRNGHNTTMA